MEHIGYSIFYLFIYIYLFIFFLYRGLEVGGGGSGAKKTYYGISANGELAVYVYVVTLEESSKSLIQGRTKPIVPL